MDLEQQVCSVELAQELKDLEVGQDSHWQWRWRKNFWSLERVDQGIVPAEEWFPAFTVAELGEMLPQSIDETEISDKVGGKRYSLLIMNPRGSADGWMVGYGWLNLRLEYPKEWLRRERASKEADARAKMLIWLLENDMVCSDKTGSADEIEPGGDSVNHPDHYTSGGLEVIDIIEAKDLGYHLGNAVKYILRMGLKDSDKWAEDLEKAVWYIERYIQFRNAQEDLMVDDSIMQQRVTFKQGGDSDKD